MSVKGRVRRQASAGSKVWGEIARRRVPVILAGGFDQRTAEEFAAFFRGYGYESDIEEDTEIGEWRVTAVR